MRSTSMPGMYCPVSVMTNSGSATPSRACSENRGISNTGAARLRWIAEKSIRPCAMSRPTPMTRMPTTAKRDVNRFSSAYEITSTITSTGSTLAPPKALTPNCSRMPASRPAAMPPGIMRTSLSKAPDMPSTMKPSAEIT
ncbi:hypothetical protein D9M68_809970 [compost metagenome]